jgi:hypothetical protein
VFDYTRYKENEIVQSIGILKDSGVDAIYPSSRYFVDDYVDNLLYCIEAQDKFGINGITNGDVIKPQQYDNITQSKVYGIQFKSLNSAKIICGQ